MDPFIQKVADELKIDCKRVSVCQKLLSEGGTVPFIARYRKEATGGLDEVGVAYIRDRLKDLADFNARLEAIKKSLAERSLLSGELAAKLASAKDLTELEDLYLPYRPKRRTRAMDAREKGLEPLAEKLLEQIPEADPMILAKESLAAGAKADDEEAALAGARDIIAETASMTKEAREAMRALFLKESVLTSRVKPGQEESAASFKDFFEWEDWLANVPAHRYLALRRAEAEGLIMLSAQPDQDKALSVLKGFFIKNDSPCAAQVEKALADGYKRLLAPSLELEARLEAKKRADIDSIEVFATNLKELLLAPPLGAKPVLAIDPGFKSGCKVVALSADGQVLEHATIHPHSSGEGRLAHDGKVLTGMALKHKIAVVAIGSGTAGRETLDFTRKIPDFPSDIPKILVSESGASIYSASEAAREEFASLDLVYRGAVSIGRRLMDPLAELVKLDPKTIGVGQYQHDVDQGLLNDKLDDVVVSCVNKVGVEVNTASEKLLSYVSGLGPMLAKNIVEHRKKNGPFKNRLEFLKVQRLGPKTFEQCAGFMRLAASDNPLDQSAVHPESYHVVEAMASDLSVSVSDLIKDQGLRKRIKLGDYVSGQTGLPTLNDIMSELDKPGRDPRKEFKFTAFREDVTSIGQVQVGMTLPGVVTNVAVFGAFIDVGLHHDGMAHVSKIVRRFIKSPAEVLAVGQEVLAEVIKVEPERERIELSLLSDPVLNPVSETRRDKGAAAGGQRRGQGAGSKPINRGDGSTGRRESRTAAKPPQPRGSFNASFEKLKNLFDPSKP